MRANFVTSYYQKLYSWAVNYAKLCHHWLKCLHMFLIIRKAGMLKGNQMVLTWIFFGVSPSLLYFGRNIYQKFLSPRYWIILQCLTKTWYTWWKKLERLKRASEAARLLRFVATACASSSLLAWRPLVRTASTTKAERTNSGPSLGFQIEGEGGFL